MGVELPDYLTHGTGLNQSTRSRPRCASSSGFRRRYHVVGRGRRMESRRKYPFPENQHERALLKDKLVELGGDWQEAEARVRAT